MRKIVIFLFLIGLFATTSAQSPFKGFFKANVSKDLLIQEGSTKALGKPVILIRPTFSLNAIKFMKSDIQGQALDVQSFQSGGIGASLVFFNGFETNFAINALALTAVDLSGATPFSISPAIAIEGWNVVSFGVGRDTGVKKWFGLINLTYSFTAIK